MRALAPIWPEELAAVKFDPPDRPWLETLAEVLPDWSRFLFDVNISYAPVPWDNIVFAVRCGFVLRQSDFERLQAHAPLGASEALGMAAVDRGQAFMCDLLSHNRRSLLR